jgi:hypothetical protein
VPDDTVNHSWFKLSLHWPFTIRWIDVYQYGSTQFFLSSSSSGAGLALGHASGPAVSANWYLSQSQCILLFYIFQ